MTLSAPLQITRRLNLKSDSVHLLFPCSLAMNLRTLRLVQDRSGDFGRNCSLLRRMQTFTDNIARSIHEF